MALPLSLFTCPDVERKPGWLSNPWLLAALAAGAPADLTLALLTGVPRLESALRMTELPIPGGTLALIAVGHFLARWWWVVVPPLVAAPVLLTWRLRERAVPLLQVWIVAMALLLAVICLMILLPIRTIATAPAPG